ncbi:MAG TPA: serine/threonine-protein kinase, partial [Nannocystaceae bacterium]|nr:serine/threonine-protein kinase [Nannocystaceae bacterium]
MEGAAEGIVARGVLAPGAVVGRYVLGRRLARGGMAELFLAKARGVAGFEKPCVLKLVLPHLADDRGFAEMFLAEARLASTLDHPNVVHVADIGEVGGEYFFVMEYVHGRDVRALLRAQPGALPLPAALTIAHGIAEGLHYVHEHRDADGKFLGLVHRDVSPSNVMVRFDGCVKLVDFGIAKATEQRNATRTGVLKGKVHYMSPEQCEGHAVDRRTDVFALGILLYEMTTGRTLFAGANDYYVMSRIVRGIYARPREVDPTYPEMLERIVLRALSRHPADRYVSAQALQLDLEAFAREARISLSPRVLAQTMLELFGDVPPLADDDETAPTTIHVGSSGALAMAPAAAAPTDVLPMRPSAVRRPPRATRLQGAVIALGLALVTAGVGGYSLRRAFEDASTAERDAADGGAS